MRRRWLNPFRWVHGLLLAFAALMLISGFVMAAIFLGPPALFLYLLLKAKATFDKFLGVEDDEGREGRFEMERIKKHRDPSVNEREGSND